VTGWVSYDSVVALYERVAVPWFAPIARDLIAGVEISPGSSVLDVGTGTGLVAGLASDVAGGAGLVVGVDPSLGMLRSAQAQRGLRVVAAIAPGLPFTEASFDVVTANLVISHFSDLDRGLADMARLLRSKGRLGLTAWAPNPEANEDPSLAADAVVASVRIACGMESEAPIKGAPWEDELRNKRRLSERLSDASLTPPTIELRTYRHTFSTADYVSGWAGLGRYLRFKYGEQRWHDFSTRADAELRKRLGDSVVSVKRVWIAVSGPRA
jgi:SAM-dependent methyltransferase